MHPTILTIQNDGAIYGKMFYVNGAAIYRLVNKDGAWCEQVIYACRIWGRAELAPQWSKRAWRDNL